MNQPEQLVKIGRRGDAFDYLRDDSSFSFRPLSFGDVARHPLDADGLSIFIDQPGTDLYRHAAAIFGEHCNVGSSRPMAI